MSGRKWIDEKGQVITAIHHIKTVQIMQHKLQFCINNKLLQNTGSVQVFSSKTRHSQME
jgi:hypothetical protein